MQDLTIFPVFRRALRAPISFLLAGVGLTLIAFAAANTSPRKHTLSSLVSAENSNLVARCQKGVLTPRQKWNLQNTVTAYRQIHQRSANFDAPAIEALETFALSREMPPGEQPEPVYKRVGLAADKARNMGCKDPMIDYLWYRFSRFRFARVIGDFSAAEYNLCARELAKSGYSPGRKFGACIYAVQRYHELRSYPPELQSLAQMAGSFLKEALDDETMLTEDAYLFCDAYFRECRVASNDCHHAWVELRPAIEKRLGKTHYAPVLEGLVHIQWAWTARGTGFADSVTPEGWRLMRERLVIAQHALEKAWSMNPKDSLGPTLMIEVVSLLSYDHAEMEKWFIRAMENNPDNYAACATKLNFLTPRWGGSEDDLIAFGRHCLTNTAWTVAVAEILPLAYGEIGLMIPESERRMAYWRQPQVWPEVRTAYEKLFRARSPKTTLREDFAQWGFLCGQKEEAQKILASYK